VDKCAYVRVLHRKLVRVYKHLLSPASSEGMKLPWVKDVTEDVLRQRSEAEAQKESHPDE
jgi:hypothetical protein